MKLPDGNSLCHFDYHPGNIMIQDGKPLVIDWMTMCTGNSCADIARTYLILTYGELPHAGYVTKTIISLFQRHICKIYYKEYLKISGQRKEDIESWILPVAVSRLQDGLPNSEIKKLLELINDKIKTLDRKKRSV